MRILCLRIARRALAAAVLHDDRFEVLDGRHLSSDRAAAEEAATKYVERFLGASQVRGAVLLAPAGPQDNPTSMLRVVQTALVRAGVSLRIVHCDELMAIFGYPPLASRGELQQVAETLVPEAAAFQGASRPYVLEAAALALYMDTLVRLMNGKA